VLAAGCLVGTAPGPAAGDAARAPSTPHRWSGYAIRATGDADGGWIGGYRVGRTSLYVTTPTRSPNRAGYRTPREVADAAGRQASRSETERAAWILSKYGGYRDATQAAAVDASVYHLLVGGRWHIRSSRGARRIRQAGDPASVARFARIMLRQSRGSAGAYTAQLAASGADVGGTVAVTLSVLDGHGRPAAGLPVTLAMTGGAALTSVTGDDGRAVGTFAAAARGWQDVTATVHQVPEHRLHVWPPARKGQAAAAEGGARRTIVVSTQAPVRGPQTLALAADPGQLVVGSPARVVASVSGGGTARAAGATLHGPYPTATAASCAGASVGSVSRSVTGDGSYALPALTPAGGGYFVWRVAVEGTATDLPVAACGATVKVRSRASASVAGDASFAPLGELGATASISGLPYADQVSTTATLAGPYASAQAAAADSCATPAGEATRVRSGNGAVHFTVAVTDPGVYAWQVQVSPGDLWLGSRSVCAASGTVVSVQ
jgi:hypothetical protein